MPSDFDLKDNGLEKLHVAAYHGLVFATFSNSAPPLHDYLGPAMRWGIDRIFHKPIIYLGCTRQYSKSNWKLYTENVRDTYHASLLHPFFSTFNLARATTRTRKISAENGLHSCLTVFHTEDASGGAAYRDNKIASFKEGFRLEDTSILTNLNEFDEAMDAQIQSVFPQLVLQQIQNSLVARQLLPKGPDNFELIFHFFGYADDPPEIREQRIKQANLVGPAGLISMEDTLATELVRFGAAGSDNALSVVDMGRDASEQEQASSMISENLVRRFWQGYRELMGL